MNDKDTELLSEAYDKINEEVQLDKANDFMQQILNSDGKDEDWFVQLIHSMRKEASTLNERLKFLKHLIGVAEEKKSSNEFAGGSITTKPQAKRDAEGNPILDNDYRQRRGDYDARGE